MQQLVQWINTPEINCVVLGALCLAVFILFILLGLHHFTSKRRYRPLTSTSLIGVYIIIVILVGFAVFAILHTGSKYNRYLDMLTTANLPLSEITVLDMQANTLTISTLVVAIATIVLTLLSLYKERKTEINKRDIEESLKKIQQAEIAIKNLSNIVSLTFVSENHKECYYDAVNKLIDQNKNNSPFYNHFRIAQISLINNGIANREDEIALSDTYNDIINIAEEIISSDEVTELDSQFAYLEALHALYLKIKNSIQHNETETIEDDIKKAFSFLKIIEKNLKEDTYGHVANLTALTYFWSGMYKKRHGDKLGGERLFEQAYKKIGIALKKNRSKIEFLNHKAVILHQLYNSTMKTSYHTELMKTYDTVFQKTKQYYKTNLNYAGTIIRDVGNELKLPELDTFPDFNNAITVNNPDNPETKKKIDGLLKQLKKAKTIIRNNIKISPDFINNHYKLGEAITIQLAIQKYGDQEKQDANRLIEQARNAFKAANMISNKSNPCKYCEYAFCTLINDNDRAIKLKSEIEENMKTKT